MILAPPSGRRPGADAPPPAPLATPLPPLRSVSLFTMWGPPYVTLFAYYMRPPSISFIANYMGPLWSS